MIFFFNYYVRSMSNYFISQLLVCLLMLPALLRILISNRKQKDTLIIFAPVAFFMSLMLVPAFELTFSILLLIIESTLIFIVNIPSLNRYSKKLYIDSFSPIYITFTSILSVAFILIVIFLFMNRPEPMPHSETIPDIKKTVFRMEGTHSNGFSESDRAFFLPDAVFYTVENNNETTDKPVVVFLTDVYTVFRGNEATVTMLTERQNIVVAGDFFCKDGKYTDSSVFNRDARSFCLRYLKQKESPDIKKSETYWKSLKKSELAALLSFAKQRYTGHKIFIIADGLSAKAAEEYVSSQAADIKLLALDESITGYIPGYGNYAVLEPFFYDKKALKKTSGWIQAQQIAEMVEQFK